MKTTKPNTTDKQNSTSNTASYRLKDSDNKGANILINEKPQVLDRDSNTLGVHTTELEPPIPVLIIKPENEAFGNRIKPTLDGGVDQKNLTFKVKIGDRVFDINRDKFYNKSTFFRNILLKRELSDDSPFILEGVEAAAFEPICKWMHSGEIAIGPENIGNILEVAIKLEIDDLVRTCLGFRDLMLESAGLMHAYEVASKYEMKDVMEDALRRMRIDFMKLAKSTAFLDYNVNQLCQLLDDSDLHIDSEMDILDACVRWLTSNWEKRQEHFIRVLDCVRFPLLSTATLVILATGGEDNESQINKEIWRRTETKKKVFDALVFKAGLQSSLHHKVVHLKPKLRNNLKCSSGSIDIEKLENENQAVTKLQAGLRGYNSRKSLAEKNEAAEKIQGWYKQKKKKSSSSTTPQYILALKK